MGKKKAIFPIILIFFIGSFNLFAQNNEIINQYWEMPTLYNPAYSGNVDFFRIRGGGRLNQLGTHDFPKTFLGSIDSPFKIYKSKIGAGLIVNSSSFDLFHNLLLGAQGSYKFKVKKGTISLGVQFGYFHSKFKGNELKAENSTPEEKLNDTYVSETELPLTDVEGGKFDLGIGLSYENQHFHIGVAELHLTNSTVKLSETTESAGDYKYIESKLPAMFYLESGGNIDLKNTLFKLQPSIILRTDFNDFYGVAEFRSTYDDKFTFGIDYRWNKAFGIIAGFYFKDFYLGYSWEYDYRNRIKGSVGNHEFVIGYQFKLNLDGKKKYAHRSIRLM